MSATTPRPYLLRSQLTGGALCSTVVVSMLVQADADACRTKNADGRLCAPNPAHSRLHSLLDAANKVPRA